MTNSADRTPLKFHPKLKDCSTTLDALKDGAGVTGIELTDELVGMATRTSEITQALIKALLEQHEILPIKSEELTGSLVSFMVRLSIYGEGAAPVSAVTRATAHCNSLLRLVGAAKLLEDITGKKMNFDKPG